MLLPDVKGTAYNKTHTRNFLMFFTTDIRRAFCVHSKYI